MGHSAISKEWENAVSIILNYPIKYRIMASISAQSSIKIPNCNIQGGNAINVQSLGTQSMEFNARHAIIIFAVNVCQFGMA